MKKQILYLGMCTLLLCTNTTGAYDISTFGGHESNIDRKDQIDSMYRPSTRTYSRTTGSMKCYYGQDCQWTPNNRDTYVTKSRTRTRTPYRR